MDPSLESNAKLGNEKSEDLKPVGEEDVDALWFCMEKMATLVLPMALRSALQLGIFDILAKAGEGAELSANDIAVEIGTNNPKAPSMVDRILSLLVTHSLLCCSVSNPQPQSERLYSLSRVSKYFVTDSDGISLGFTLTLVVDEVCYKSWGELTGAIVEGGVAFDRAHGMNAFEYPSVDPRFNEVFNKAMIGNTTLTTKKILELYKGFEHVTKLVDVGGGLGINLKLITSKYPHIQGINFDLPHVLQHAPLYAGVEHVGGDMFQSVPSADAIFMKWILHDWSDEQCLKLLKNCYKAIPDDGMVIVVETVLPLVPETTVASRCAFTSDLMMMTQNPGGKERTHLQFTQFAQESGFSGVRFVCCVCGLWIMEFYK
ncbi:anthranilate N-methyltransferase-like [Abrus precatorius]|uniref:caffeate O-methyltransferase n=1 Tax=Abrus precatorius TaxID=3816 RepID=A0A8B8L0S3_ABRPR|nr:anthranilate N-methyltransferase-like [Abrus precatorius]